MQELEPTPLWRFDKDQAWNNRLFLGQVTLHSLQVGILMLRTLNYRSALCMLPAW